MLLKILFIFLTFLYHTSVFSKPTDNNNFNQRYLSNYFSAIVAYDNKDNELSLKYFNSTKSILRDHPEFFDKYISNLVLNNKVREAIKQIKFFKSKNNTDHFQTTLLLTIDSLKNNDFKKTKNHLLNMEKVFIPNTYEQIIYEILKSYNQLFLEKKISKVKDYGKLSQIILAFQHCYLDDDKADNYFVNLINLDGEDYSRYLFFYISNLISKNQFEFAKLAASEIEPIISTLLILQSKSWLDQSKFDNFSSIFSCKSENDILAELFFIVSNLYSSQEDYDMSNFYLNISTYLNPKFKFNLSLKAENYYLMNKYTQAEKVLKEFNDKDSIYYWYRIKKEFDILKETEGKEKSLNFLNSKIINLKIKYPKIYFSVYFSKHLPKFHNLNCIKNCNISWYR